MKQSIMERERKMCNRRRGVGSPVLRTNDLPSTTDKVKIDVDRGSRAAELVVVCGLLGVVDEATSPAGNLMPQD